MADETTLADGEIEELDTAMPWGAAETTDADADDQDADSSDGDADADDA